MLHPIKKVAAGVTALAALGLGGSALASAASSSTTSPTAATSTSPLATSTNPNPQGRPGPSQFPAHGTAAHEDAEKAVTGQAALKAQTAAVKSVGGGSAGAVSTDFTGNGFEVTVTKTDGTKVEIHLDSSYNVVQGPGGHRGQPPAYGGQPPSFGG